MNLADSLKVSFATKMSSTIRFKIFKSLVIASAIFELTYVLYKTILFFIESHGRRSDVYIYHRYDREWDFPYIFHFVIAIVVLVGVLSNMKTCLIFGCLFNLAFLVYLGYDIYLAYSCVNETCHKSRRESLKYDQKYIKQTVAGEIYGFLLI
jgi:hypothetical protein